MVKLFTARRLPVLMVLLDLITVNESGELTNLFMAWLKLLVAGNFQHIEHFVVALEDGRDQNLLFGTHSPSA